MLLHKFRKIVVQFPGSRDLIPTHRLDVLVGQGDDERVRLKDLERVFAHTIGASINVFSSFEQESAAILQRDDPEKDQGHKQ